MERLDFEYFIRACYNCGRYEKPGANADLFDGLISAKHRRDNVKKDSPDYETVLIDYGIELGSLSTFVSIALKHVIENKSIPNSDILRSLSDLRDRLFPVEFDELMSVIKDASSIIFKAGLPIG